MDDGPGYRRVLIVLKGGRWGWIDAMSVLAE